jgi:1,4-alpha-glucan branching enzyme
MSDSPGSTEPDDVRDAREAQPVSELDRYLFNEGTHTSLYERLGGHVSGGPGHESTRFAVWAPNAEQVSVIGDFNDWTKEKDLLRPLANSGVFEGTIPGVGRGMRYKYHIRARGSSYRVDKADPFGFGQELPPGTASIVTDLDYRWHDEGWMAGRAEHFRLDGPVSIYEVHLGSWRHVVEDGNRSLTYEEMGPALVEYVREMGFTHVEFLPVMEHPFYPSWGYEPTGLFAPTARYGSPQGFMKLVDTLHQAEIGVVLDWVPAHFPTDEHGLGYFDGTHLFEHEDPRRGYHPDWNTFIYNYGRREVRCFLASSAAFWLDRYHADAIRVDGVASMLYRDYSRREGEWVPNAAGGRENEEAVSFLRWLNEVLYGRFPGIQTIAEESTAWPGVSTPTTAGGLGFGYKWDMGWMNDILDYFHEDPIHRRYRHNELSFRSLYALSEKYILPLSHDEVVHLKGSLIAKMPGDAWQKFANLRLLYGDMFATPGKKLLFMGDEFAQGSEWHHDESLAWDLLDIDWHAGVRTWVQDLNQVYRSRPALSALDYAPEGITWLEANDAEQSVLTYFRSGGDPMEHIVVVLNLTPVPRQGFRVGVPRAGRWEVLLNSDRTRYRGSGAEPTSPMDAEEVGFHGQSHSVVLDIPPLACVYLAPESRR